MPRHIRYPAGRIETIMVESRALEGNMLGDDPKRRVDVWIPHGMDPDGLPLLVDLAGYTGSGIGHTNWKNFGENLPEQLDRLIATGKMAPAVVACPDCFNRMGGNQYINSSAMGRWADFLVQDMLPVLEAEFRCGGDGRRGLFGKSSGGYGALVHAMLYPDTWSAAACHSGDMAFELVYLADMPKALRVLQDYEYSAKAFMADFETKQKISGRDIEVLMMLAMAASYDPAPDLAFGVQLPVTTDTCEVIDIRWQHWQQWDPINMLDHYADNLKRMKALFIDCGTLDQYNLIHGARRFHRKAQNMGIPHIYEEFRDTHSDIAYRQDVSLPMLVGALS